MRHIENVYRKKMSGIHHFQEESKVFYNLIETWTGGEKIYGIQLMSQSRTEKRTDELPDISPSEKTVRDLLTLLFENAIMIDIWRDIILDAMDKDAL